MSVNLHRLDTKLTPNTIDTLPFPSNCEFHIMDNMCDPDSWIQPITSSRFTKHRTFVLHPKIKHHKTSTENYLTRYANFYQQISLAQYQQALKITMTLYPAFRTCIKKTARNYQYI